MKRFRQILIIAAIAACGLGAHASVHTDSVRVSFRVNRTGFDPTFAGNADSLRAFESRITPILSDSARFVVRKISIVGGASPEGSVKLNEELSRGRARKLYELFRDRRPDVTARSGFEHVFLGRDWSQLLDRVKADPKVPMRSEVIALLEQITGSLAAGHPDSDLNLRALKTLGNGKPYAYLFANHFAPLRVSVLTMVLDRRDISPVSLALPLAAVANTMRNYVGVPAAPLVSDLLLRFPQAVAMPAPAPRPDYYLGLRTNLLYDLAAIPNLGVEAPVGRHFSVGANWMYGWWNNDNFNFYWRLYGGEATLRYWFGEAADRAPLTGHHLGVGAAMFTYDFELGGDGIMGGIPGGTLWDRCNYAAWGEYGYSLPLGPRFNLDFTLGLGYVEGEYRRYEPLDGHYVWRSTHRLRYIGPTKAEVSLVWRINLLKGGDR